MVALGIRTRVVAGLFLWPSEWSEKKFVESMGGHKAERNFSDTCDSVSGSVDPTTVAPLTHPFF